MLTKKDFVNNLFFTYTYDNDTLKSVSRENDADGGNILSQQIHGYTTGMASGSTIKTNDYEYRDG